VTDRIRRALLGTFIYSTAASFAPRVKAESVAENFLGTWSAFLEQDDPPTRLKLVIEDDHSGHLTVIDAGEVPISRLQISGATLHLEIAQPPLIYNATLAGDRITGMCRRGDQDIALDFVRGDLYTEPPLITFPAAPLSARRLHELRVMARAPAMGVGWQFRGKSGHVLVDGNRSINAPVAVTRKDQWHLGSITKSMTATLAARIVETGALQWNARIGDVLGSVVTGMRPEYRDITLLHILSHRGGLPRDLESMRDAKGDYLQRRDYVEAALRMPPVAAPAEQMLYSNVDYVVAGLMLETVGRQPWETLIAHHVFEPLGIRSFGFGPPGSIDKLDQPQGHEPAPRGLRPTRYDVPEAMAPAGRVHMNLDDLLLYLAAHRDRPIAFLKEASWQTLQTPPFGGDYALGWSVSSSGVLSHGGTNQKWKAEVVVDRARDLVCGSTANVLNNNTQSALLQLLESARLSA
jgi:CubicO group peptidase (beta-lactamase class C family)